MTLPRLSYSNVEVLPVASVMDTGFPDHPLRIAKGFGLETVAECVEDGTSAEILAAEGADYLQGFYFAKPDLERSWAQMDVIKPAAEPTRKTRRAKVDANGGTRRHAVG